MFIGPSLFHYKHSYIKQDGVIIGGSGGREKQRQQKYNPRHPKQKNSHKLNLDQSKKKNSCRKKTNWFFLQLSIEKNYPLNRDGYHQSTQELYYDI